MIAVTMKMSTAAIVHLVEAVEMPMGGGAVDLLVGAVVLLVGVVVKVHAAARWGGKDATRRRTVVILAVK